MTSDQQELQAHSLSLMHQVENKHFLFLNANITKATKDPKLLGFIADLESSEVKISGLIVPFCKMRSAGCRRFYLYRLNIVN